MTAKTFLLQTSSRPRSNHFKSESSNIPLAPVPIAPNTHHHNHNPLELENDNNKKKKKSSLVVRTSKHWVLPPRPRPGRRSSSHNSVPCNNTNNVLSIGAGSRSNSSNSTASNRKQTSKEKRKPRHIQTIDEKLISDSNYLAFLKFDDLENEKFHSSASSISSPSYSSPSFSSYRNRKKSEFMDDESCTDVETIAAHNSFLSKNHSIDSSNVNPPPTKKSKLNELDLLSLSSTSSSATPVPQLTKDLNLNLNFHKAPHNTTFPESPSDFSPADSVSLIRNHSLPTNLQVKDKLNDLNEIKFFNDFEKLEFFNKYAKVNTNNDINENNDLWNSYLQLMGNSASKNNTDDQQEDNDDNMPLLNLPILEEPVPSEQDNKSKSDDKDIWNCLPSTSSQQGSLRILNKNANFGSDNIQVDNDESYLFLQDQDESTSRPQHHDELSSEIALPENKFSYLPPTLEELMEEQDGNSSRSFKNFMFSNENGIACPNVDSNTTNDDDYTKVLKSKKIATSKSNINLYDLNENDNGASGTNEFDQSSFIDDLDDDVDFLKVQVF